MSITLRMIWRTQDDAEVCPTCKALEGYTWIVKAGEPYPKQLIHPLYGPVYDTRPAAEGSLVKEKHGHICRCTLIHQFDVSNIFARGNSEIPNGTVQEEAVTEEIT